jgi:hypothetical protein
VSRAWVERGVTAGIVVLLAILALAAPHRSELLTRDGGASSPIVVPCVGARFGPACDPHR